MSVDAFFAYARKRHQIYLDRGTGKVTDDPILFKFRFCNVFRELDTTTIWFRENVRDDPRYRDSVILATVLFRWFNRIRTGEALFQQTSPIPDWINYDPPLDFYPTAFEAFAGTGSLEPLRHAILSYCGSGPFVTGSYIIKTPDGMNKMEGVLWCVRKFWEGRNGWIPEQGDTLSSMHKWLMEFPYLGHFMAYEIVTDLRHTWVLDKAPDIMTWANPGPGAMRGMNRIAGDVLGKPMTHLQMQNTMRYLLEFSTFDHNWPTEWPQWEMREVEHTLCEFDKYERVRLGEGTPRQVYRR